MSNVLLETWYFDSGRVVNLITEQGIASKTDATAAQLRDGDDLTADTLTVSGSGGVVGLARKDVDWMLGNVLAALPVETIGFVRVRIRAEVTGSQGSASIIYLRRKGVTFTSRDFLSAPVGALMWVEYDYPTEPTGDPWIYADLIGQSWGFESIIETLLPTDTNVLRVCEAQIEIWGTSTGLPETIMRGGVVGKRAAAGSTGVHVRAGLAGKHTVVQPGVVE